MLCCVEVVDATLLLCSVGGEVEVGGGTNAFGDCGKLTASECDPCDEAGIQFSLVQYSWGDSNLPSWHYATAVPAASWEAAPGARTDSGTVLAADVMIGRRCMCCAEYHMLKYGDHFGVSSFPALHVYIMDHHVPSCTIM